MGLTITLLILIYAVYHYEGVNPISEEDLGKVYGMFALACVVFVLMNVALRLKLLEVMKMMYKFDNISDFISHNMINVERD